MLKVLCLFAVFVVVAAMPHPPEWPSQGPAPIGRIVKRETKVPQRIPTNPEIAKEAPESALTADDDMDKAETFGFGYHHYYAYPRYYYPNYYYGYYPYYDYGYYW
ncbi:uncharacterized protein LOC126563396 [Anopheles maculipalpis]|uniref:uncharacterized protein LOC126563396 n=1 Tax=Anopheles maculipalpis TaxID=1496333 RepID=UPI0021594F12|nr:uncharacterized protein LOC126563396 [Anopheles maculipalpis]